MSSRFKIFSDPVHGFISVPQGIVLDLIDTPEVQRLRRIRQLGIGYLVFPGAEHSRFGHALGAMALMHDCLSSLSDKETRITADEHRAAMLAALLHDIGHGPFSHTLENEVIRDFHHERMSRILISRLNQKLGGALDLTLEMFDDSYSRPFFHQLVSSQLDMDRLDYLRRDSYYTGVVEGRVGVERIIKTMRVHTDRLHSTNADSGNSGTSERIAIEARGIHAVENFLIARRLMYWQVYLHKTILAGDHMLRSIIRRVRSLLGQGFTAAVPGTSPSFLFFLENDVGPEDLQQAEIVQNYCDLDDTDIIFSLKSWSRSSDRILADLSRRVLERDFFRVRFFRENISHTLEDNWRDRVRTFLKKTGLSTDMSLDADLEYYLAFEISKHEAYETGEDSIGVIQNGELIELSKALEVSALSGLTEPESRHYMCFPKEVDL